MSDSHFKSNLLGKAGTETISGFASVTTGEVIATTLTVGTSGHYPTLTASTFTATTINVNTAASIPTLNSNQVNATNLTVYTSAHSPTVTASNVVATTATTKRYIKFGDGASVRYIFFGSAPTEASVVAAATAVSASLSGSLYMGTSSLWLFDADSTATRFQTF